MAASSQPLAVEAAINILRSGGNAIDAAVTATLVLAVIEPMSTGLGGDCFSLIYLNQEKRLLGLNASGRAPDAISVEALHKRGIEEMPLEGPLSITVPGMLDGLVQCLARYGTISLQDALKPAIEFAESGFPVPEITSQMWQRSVDKLQRNSESAHVFLPEGSAPQPGQVFRNADLARTLKTIAGEGHNALYNGSLGEKIVNAVCALGGLISLTDLSEHTSDWVEPIRTIYRGYEVIELPPNNQGLTTLIALNIVEGYPLRELTHNSTQYLHNLIEAMKTALYEAQANISDPQMLSPVARLLSREYAAELRAQISSSRARTVGSRSAELSGDTVYVAVVDEAQNVVSMISSLFKAFGSGVTIPGTGLLLQNRGSGFVLEPNHPNLLGPGKRPFHTIMPGMIMRDNQPWACLGVVGGMMQAQGQLQIICNLIDFGMDPQSAVEAPRFRVLEEDRLAIEEGIEDQVRAELASLGHNLDPAASQGDHFGGAQVIQVLEGTLFGGSDPRKDGCALGY